MHSLSISFSFSAWVIPTLISFLSIFAAWFFTRKEDGMFAGIGFLIALVPALFVCSVAWISYSIFLL